MPQPSQSVIPYITGVIITPTPSILQYTVPSIQKSSVPATETSTLIQTSPTTSEVLPSSTLSAADEKMKKLEEGKEGGFQGQQSISVVLIKDSTSVRPEAMRPPLPPSPTLSFCRSAGDVLHNHHIHLVLMISFISVTKLNENLAVSGQNKKSVLH